jgi:UDP-N-acetylglucosamine diphosphorylase/glucosamine-1-phosphate N-acetyltransferase
MNTILFDDQEVSHLYPFTLTRPAALIRCGILTVAEKWELCLSADASYSCAEHLSGKYSVKQEAENLFINGRVLPDAALHTAIQTLASGEALQSENCLIAYRGAQLAEAEQAKSVQYAAEFFQISRIHNIFSFNHHQINLDFERITNNRVSQTLSSTNTVIGKHPIFLEEGAKAEAAVFNTSEGPIYLGKNSEVMEGALIRGPFALCESAGIKMGAKIYNGTTVGPHSKVGGEVSNSVIFAYSNKGHDGFLGNSVLGEWCNLGADTNNSNLKNNYEIVKLWNYQTERFEKTGLQFCGLFMGDHSKCGINTMFNTGTVVGVSANIFGSGFPRNFVPSFSWGGAQGFETYMPAKAFQTAELVMQRRHIELSEDDKNILNYIYTLESKFRNWEKS